MIAENFSEIKSRIQIAALRVGRNPDEVKLVAAVKGKGVQKIEEAVGAGIRLIGHNYIQEAAAQKPSYCPSDLKFHMIGHVQRNKAKKACELFDVIETVDDARILKPLDTACSEIKKKLDLMIQVNLAGEVQKSGVPKGEALTLITAIKQFDNLRVIGLMTMPPFSDDPEKARPFFSELRDLRNQLMNKVQFDVENPELSMGMTGDFEAAIEEGATIVRIGTALFGPRLKNW
ncbi:MAG: YggS family pyridoxal phosphate-dependent enzyme [Desulfomonilaceae bacterium]